MEIEKQKTRLQTFVCRVTKPDLWLADQLSSVIYNSVLTP